MHLKQKEHGLKMPRRFRGRRSPRDEKRDAESRWFSGDLFDASSGDAS
jgi:hypothetical protein